MSNWFSNFTPYTTPLTEDMFGCFTVVSYTTPEHYYQAMKTTNIQEQLKVISCKTAKDAKAMGRKVTIRPDWDDVKLSVMEKAIRHRLKVDDWFIEKLKATNGEIVEVNYWHDNYWGNCTCQKCKDKVGQNQLGRLLMKLRGEL